MRFKQIQNAILSSLQGSGTDLRDQSEAISIEAYHKNFSIRVVLMRYNAIVFQRA